MQEFNQFSRPKTEEIELLPSVQKILAMKPHFSEEEFNERAKSGSYTFVSEEVSEDAFLRNMRVINELPEKEKKGAIFFNLLASLMNILDRDSMIGNPNRELYIEGIRELNRKYFKREPEWFPASR
ncbi:hypothetical protein A3B84_01030 [Candidatus Nomurabacteria bacterium RIFCSPHIGHO2_02_FULL_35_13]|uniref:Uncharacterized protein n=1 Tax=Candidatus Nomurabacteria bacterium RIFCSPHIGHO2_02_FULL_35_13 TaxID=1801748 RepID=A0A1F6VQL4_9BACT|nr:MAG: hypothetical protein A3B84_01030 [Candidatus Nomurabacteria bacterium RIFCSPHIGHO2_02_FULL_35_13]